LANCDNCGIYKGTLDYLSTQAEVQEGVEEASDEGCGDPAGKPKGCGDSMPALERDEMTPVLDSCGA